MVYMVFVHRGKLHYWDFAFHAAERPNSVAFVIDGREISYSEFACDIRKLARALREFELPTGRSPAGILDHITSSTASGAFAFAYC